MTVVAKKLSSKYRLRIRNRRRKDVPKTSTPPVRPADHKDKHPKFREGDRVKLVNFPDLVGYVMSVNTRKNDFRCNVFDYQTNQFKVTVVLDKNNYIETFESLLDWE